MGFEPTYVGITIRCDNHYATPTIDMEAAEFYKLGSACQSLMERVLNPTPSRWHEFAVFKAEAKAFLRAPDLAVRGHGDDGLVGAAIFHSALKKEVI